MKKCGRILVSYLVRMLIKMETKDEYMMYLNWEEVEMVKNKSEIEIEKSVLGVFDSGNSDEDVFAIYYIDNPDIRIIRAELVTKENFLTSLRIKNSGESWGDLLRQEKILQTRLELSLLNTERVKYKLEVIRRKLLACKEKMKNE